MSGQVVLLVRLLRAGLVQQLACCHCASGRAPAAQVLNKHHAGRPILYLGGLAAAAGLLGSRDMLAELNRFGQLASHGFVQVWGAPEMVVGRVRPG